MKLDNDEINGLLEEMGYDVNTSSKNTKVRDTNHSDRLKKTGMSVLKGRSNI